MEPILAVAPFCRLLMMEARTSPGGGTSCDDGHQGASDNDQTRQPIGGAGGDGRYVHRRYGARRFPDSGGGVDGGDLRPSAIGGRSPPAAPRRRCAWPPQRHVFADRSPRPVLPLAAGATRQGDGRLVDQPVELPATALPGVQAPLAARLPG